MSSGLTKENLLFAFPVGLRENSYIAALGDVTAEALTARMSEISRISLYPRIDELPEDLLDILAYDFKVDWWDPNYTVEEKRRTLADSWRVHKMLGTKAAVETAIRDIYPKADVQEWFEYGGKPYHFKLQIDLTHEMAVSGKPGQVIERVSFYKSLRSHLDSIQYIIVLPPAKLHIGGNVGTQMQIGVPLEPDVCDFRDTLHLGGSFGATPEIGVPCEPDSVRFQGTLHAGGVVSSHMKLPVPEDTAQPPATTILRTGGVCTIISNLSKGE